MSNKCMKDQISVMNGESTSISDLTVKGFWNRNWGNVESSYRSKIIHLHFQLTIIRHEKFHLANINSTKMTKYHITKRPQLVTNDYFLQKRFGTTLMVLEGRRTLSCQSSNAKNHMANIKSTKIDKHFYVRKRLLTCSGSVSGRSSVLKVLLSKVEVTLWNLQIFGK